MRRNSPPGAEAPVTVNAGTLTIKAGGALGLINQPIIINSSSFSLSATLSSGTNSVLASGTNTSLYVQSNSNIVLTGTSSSGGDFVLTTNNNSSITLSGSIQAGAYKRGTILQTNGMGTIRLNPGSSIVSQGNVKLLAGGGGYPFLTKGLGLIKTFKYQVEAVSWLPEDGTESAF